MDTSMNKNLITKDLEIQVNFMKEDQILYKSPHISKIKVKVRTLSY